MKKMLRILLFVVLIFGGYACKDEAQPADPFDIPNDDRTPTAFTLEAQQGMPLIVDSSLNDAEGTVTVIVEPRESDISSLRLEDIRIPRGATANIARGDRLDLSDGDSPATFSVTSESGLKRTYTIIYKEPARSPGKSVLGFTLAGQIGDAEIIDDPDDDAKGSITLNLSTRKPDAADVEITALTVVEGATASVAVGSTLTFTGYQTSFTVTADDSSVRTFTVTYIPEPEIEDPLIGTWVMSPRFALEDWSKNAVFVEGGVSGNSIWLNLYDKGNFWEGSYDAVDKVNKYTMVFSALSETASTVSGSVTLSAPGNDFYTFKRSNGTDFSEKYQLIPTGISNWTKNKSTGLIEFFNSSNTLLGSCYLVGPETSFTTDNSPKVTMVVGKTGQVKANVTDNTQIDPDIYGFHRPFDGNGWWNGASGDYYNDISRYWDNCRRVIWLVKRQPEE